MIRRENPIHRPVIARMAHAVRPYVDGDRGPTRAALELTRNVLAVLLCDADVEPRSLVESMIRHRMAQGWLRCGDVSSAARVAADAWAKRDWRVAA